MLAIGFIEYLTVLFSGSNFNFQYDSAWIAAIQDILSFVSWVIPLDAIIVCFSVSLAILVIRIIISIWKLLPLT